MLIVVEGPDGCGKTTLAVTLAKIFNGKYFAFPNNQGAAGKLIRAYLRKGWSIGLPAMASEELMVKEFGVKNSEVAGAMAFQALMTVNKYAAVANILIQSYVGDLNNHLFLDRYWHSAYVYGSYDGLPSDWLLDIHSCMPPANHAILLCTNPETCIKRQAGRRHQLTERYEGDTKRAQELYDLYRSLWHQTEGNQSIVGQHAHEVDGGPPSEVIAGRLATIMALDWGLRIAGEP
jgi:thymidylate kinase